MEDVVIVASVSCIYGIGDPGTITAWCCTCVRVSGWCIGSRCSACGHAVQPGRRGFRAVPSGCGRRDRHLSGGKCRACPAVEMFDDEIEHLTLSDPLTGHSAEDRPFTPSVQLRHAAATVLRGGGDQGRDSPGAYRGLPEGG